MKIRSKAPSSAPHRKSIRFKGYDYSEAGSYFITIVTKAREALSDEVVDSKMVLNEFGRIVEEQWTRSANIRKEIELDEYVVMPNHFHAIVHIIPDNNFHGTGDRPNNDIVGAYGTSRCVWVCQHRTIRPYGNHSNHHRGH